MKNTELSIFETRLEGVSLQAALDLREAARTLKNANAPLYDQLKELEKQADEVRQKIEASHEQFDEVRVAFFTALQLSLGVDISDSSLDYRDEDGSVFIHRTQEDIDRGESLRDLQNPMELIRKALTGVANVEVLQTGCNNPDCEECHPKGQQIH